jgi:hypothetical protein
LLLARVFRVGKDGICPPYDLKGFQTGRCFGPMVEPNENSHRGVKTSADKLVNDFVAGLSDEHRMLVILKAQLYGGTWEPMLDDLQNRLEGKPYIFKLINRIKDDIERIEQMRKFEQEHNIDLAEYVELS